MLRDLTYLYSLKKTVLIEVENMTVVTRDWGRPGIEGNVERKVSRFKVAVRRSKF